MGNLGEELESRFTWVDYVVFIAMLAVSACIGFYYGCIAKGTRNTEDFLMAGKSMSGFPVGMSLLASFISALLFIATPVEIYQAGITYWLWMFAFSSIPIAAYVFLPVFWKLQLTSTFEYLELRFNKNVRILGSVLFMLVMNIYISFVMYTPSMALAQVIGVNIFLIAGVATLVAVFYTALGGMKAVLWTDALQLTIFLVALLFMVVKGSLDLGGFDRVWEISTLGNRTVLFNFDPDPRERHTFWGLFLGQFWLWFSIFGINQTQVQRYMCVRKESTARTLMWTSAIGFLPFIGLACFFGLVMYAKYVECDPIRSGIISRPDQLVSLFVMDHFGHLTGFPGLFMAGIFSGSLSTVSSGINSLSAITLEDYIKKFKPNITESAATLASKVLSVVYGVIVFLLVILVSNMGDLQSTTLGVIGSIHGPLLAIFALGMLFPKANVKGAFFGTIGGFILTAWIVIGQQMAVRRKEVILGKLPINVCKNFTVGDRLTDEEILNSFSMYQRKAEELAPNLTPSALREIYRISYTWIPLISFGSSVIFGLIISKLTTRSGDPVPDPDLLSPAIYKLCSIKSTQKSSELEKKTPNTLQNEENGPNFVTKL